MESHYASINKSVNRIPVNPRKYFYRQLIICMGLWASYFNGGLSLGVPTVAIPQIRRAANSTAVVSREMASWLSSSMSYGALPWIIILPILAHYFGRKMLFLFAAATSVIDFILLYTSTTTQQLLISLVLQGLLFASNLTISIMIITEYTSPKYRGLFLTIKSAQVFWGIWASNAIGTFFDYNYIAIGGFFCAFLVWPAIWWPESPQWLASKGRFKECADSHRWLKGTNIDSEKELENLIESQKEYLKDSETRNITFKEKFSSFLSILKNQEFYKPVGMTTLIFAQYHASGKLVCGMYSIELIKAITNSESMAYTGMLILDGVSVLGMYIGCAVSRYSKRRTLLLSTSYVGILFLFAMSVYLWLVRYSVVTENKVLSIALLSGFSIAISCGPLIMSTSIYGELIPLRFKTLGMIVVILINHTLLGTFLKIAPLIFESFGLHGTFTIYGVSATFFTVLLQKYLIETKDKTMQEIEEHFKDKKINNNPMNKS